MTALTTLAVKQKVGPAMADKIMLPIFIHLDACKRNLGTNNAANQLTKCSVMLMVLGSMLKDKPMYDLACEAYEALAKACDRPDPVSFTTGEYKTIRSAVAMFNKYLPHVEVQQITKAHMHCAKVLKIEHHNDPIYVE